MNLKSLARRLFSRAFRTRRVNPIRKNPAPHERTRLNLETVEERIVPAWDMALSGASTVNVSSATAAGTTSFTASGTDANLDWLDIYNALVGGNNVSINSGSSGMEAGNITDMSAVDLTGLPDNLILTIQSGTGTGLVGNISMLHISLQGNNQSIILDAHGSVATGDLSAGSSSIPAPLANATITSENGTISDTGTIDATNINLSAETGIGSSATPLTTQTSNIGADTTTGGIFITNNAGASGTLNVNGSDGINAITSGDIQLINTGSINISTFGDPVRGMGNVTVQALGNAADIQTGSQLPNDAISNAGSGIVTIDAGEDIILGGSGAVDFGSISSTDAGGIVLKAGRNITMNANARVDVLGATGTIQATASGDIAMLTSPGSELNAPAITTAGGEIDISTGSGHAFTADSTGTDAVSSSGGAINITTDSITINQGINAGAGTVTIVQQTTGRKINLGTASGSFLGLSAAELAEITAGTLVVGNANSGDITISDAIASPAATLELNSGGAIVASAAADTITATTLNLTASDGIGTSSVPVVIDGADFTTDTSAGDGDQYLSDTGTAVLAGANSLNAGAGTITLKGGTFQVDGSIAAATVDVKGATLGGTGTITAAVVDSTGGTINPGDGAGAIGKLTVDSLSFNGGRYAADFNGNTSDQISNSGAVNLANASRGTFSVASQTGAATAGTIFVLIDNSGAGGIANPPLSGANEGGTATIDGVPGAFTYAGGDGNDFAFVANGGSPTFTISGTYTLRRIKNGAADNIQLLHGSTVVDSRPTSSITGTYTVNGSATDDTLNVNYGASGGYFPIDVAFNGGAGVDKLNMLGGSFGTIVENFTNPNNGNIQLYQNPGSDTLLSTITYTGLDPVDITGTTATDLVFNLPAAASDAVLEDDGTPGNGISRIRSSNGTFETTTFANPIGSLTVNTGNAADTLTIDALPDFDATLTAGSIANPFASVTISGAVSSNGSVSLFGNSIAVNDALSAATTATLNAGTGAITQTPATTTVTAGAISLTAADGIGTAGQALDVSTTDLTTDSTAANGNQFLSDAVGITQINLNAGGGNVTLSAAGSIQDADGGTDVTGNVVTLSTNTGEIGQPANFIATSASSWKLSATDNAADGLTQGMWVINSGGVTITSAKTTNGVINLKAGGSSTATDVESSGASRNVAIALSSGNLTVDTVSATGNATLTATTGSILDDNNQATVISANALTMTAAIDIGQPLTGAMNQDIDTTVASITASTTTTPNAGTHGIWIGETDGVTLTSVTTKDGLIHITTGGSTTATDVEAAGTSRSVSVATSSGDLTVGKVSATGNATLKAAGNILTQAGNSVSGTTISLTGPGGIGDSTNSVNLTGTNLTTDSSGNNGNQFLAATGTIVVPVADSLKAGAGNVTLTGGIFQLDGTATATTFTVTNPAVLEGTGTITANAKGTGTYSPGDTVAPTTNPGTLIITGNYMPTGTVTFDVNPPSAAAGTDYDQIKVTGTVDLSGATLTFNGVNGAVAVNQLATLIDNDGTADETTPSSNPAQGALVTIGTNVYHIFYNGGDGNDVVLVEASTPAVVYVDDSFAYNDGQVLTEDADKGTAAIDPAIYGVNAFNTIQAGINAVTNNGTIIVNTGTYAEAASLDGTKTLEVTGPDMPGTVTVNSLTTVAGSFVALDSTSKLIVGDATNKLIAGVIQGTGSFTKQGSGTVTLTGANTYQGGTTVNAGTLLVNNSTGSGTGTGAVGVNNSAKLGGTGLISGAVNINGTAHLAPGGATVGTDDPESLATGDATWVAGSFFDVEIGGTTVGNGTTGYDQLNVTGAVNLNDATLNVSQALSFVPSIGAPGTPQSFTIISNDGTDAVNGTFAGLAEGAIAGSVGGVKVYIDYRGGDGNDVVLNTQPVIHGTDGDDLLVLRKLSASQNEFSFNGASFVPVDNDAAFNFIGGKGKDQLLVDTSNGNPIPTGSVFFDGEILRIEKVTGTASDNVVIAPSTTAGMGVATITGEGDINYQNTDATTPGVESIDLVNLLSAVIHTGSSADSLTLGTGTLKTNVPQSPAAPLPSGYSSAVNADAALEITGTVGATSTDTTIDLLDVGGVNSGVYVDTTAGSAGDGHDVITINAINGTTLGIPNLSINTGSSAATDTVSIANAVVLPTGTAGEGTFSLNVAGSASETAAGSIIGQAFALTTAGAAHNDLLNANNNVQTFAANVQGQVRYNDTDALTVGTVVPVLGPNLGSSVDGINTNGNSLGLTAGALLTIGDTSNSTVDDIRVLGAGTVADITSAGVAEPATAESAAIKATNLLYRGSGSFNLTNVNQAANLATNTTTGAFRLNNGTTSLTTNTSTGLDGATVHGVTTGGQNLTLSTGSLTIGSDATGVIDAGATGNVMLTTEGVSQAATVTGSALGVQNTTTGSIALDSATNMVGTFAARNLNTSGAINFKDGQALLIGSVAADGSLFTAADGITSTDGNVAVTTTGGGSTLGVMQAIGTTGGNVQLTSSDRQSLAANVNAATGNVGLASTANGVTQTAGGVTGDTLTTNVANGGAVGTNLPGSNQVVNFNATNQNGQVLLNNTTPTLGITGISQTGGGTVGVTNSQSIGVSGAVSADGGSISTTATAGAISESGVGTIASSGLFTAVSTSGQSLGNNNAIGSFLSTNHGSGSIALTNTIGTLGITGVTQTGGGSISISNTGNATANGAITADTGSINLTASQLLTLKNDISTAGPATLASTGSNGIQQTVGADAVTVGNLTFTTSGPVTFDNQGNTVSGMLALTSSGDATLRFAGNLTIDPKHVVTTNNHNLNIYVDGNFSLVDNRLIAPSAADASNPIYKYSTPLVDIGSGHLVIVGGVENVPAAQQDTTVFSFVFDAQVKANSVQFGNKTGTAPDSNGFPTNNANRDDFHIAFDALKQAHNIQVYGNEPHVLPGDAVTPFTTDPRIASVQFLVTNSVGNSIDGKYVVTYQDGTTAELDFFEIESFGGQSYRAMLVQTGPTNYSVRLQLIQSSTPAGNAVNGQALESNPFVLAPSLVNPLSPYSAPSIALGDVDGDGRVDLIIANGSNDIPNVTVIDGKQLFRGTAIDLSHLPPADILAEFSAFPDAQGNPTFRGGLSLAVESNGQIVVGAGIGGGPAIEVWKYASGVENMVASFFAYEPTFRGGVNVAVTDYDGDGTQDVVAGAGPGGGPRVVVFNGKTIGLNLTPTPLPNGDFFAYEPQFRGGVLVAGGNFDGNGDHDIATAPGYGGGPRVEVFAYTAAGPNVLANFYAWDPNLPNGLDIGGSNANNGIGSISFGTPETVPGSPNIPDVPLRQEILVSSARGQALQMKIFNFNRGSKAPDQTRDLFNELTQRTNPAQPLMDPTNGATITENDLFDGASVAGFIADQA